MGLVAKAFQDIITFSRASSGTYVNSSGYITNSSVLNYLTYSNQPENAAWTKSNSFVQQNVFIYSQEFDNANWGPSGLSTPTANTTIAPDGTLTADTVTATASTTQHLINQATAGLTATPITISIYAKANTHNFLQIFHGALVTNYANFNISTGVVGTVGAGFTSASMNSVGNGWFRCIVTLTPTATSNVRFALVTSNTAVYNESWTTVGTESVYLWGAQCVQGSVPGDYRATTSAALPCLYADYNGALRARKLCEDATASTSHRILPGTALTIDAAGTYTYSWYVKAGELTEARLTDNNVLGATFNLTTGAPSSVSSGYTASSVSLSNGWWRLIISGAAVTANGRILIYLSKAGSTTYTGDGSSGIYIADAQLNDGSAATSYYDTTASAYNAPRSDYDPVTLAVKGLLVEEQRVNLLTYSAQFDNAVWVKTNSSITANATTAPDGTVAADKLVEDTATSIHQAYQNFVGTVAPYTFSVYAKAAERTVVTLLHGSGNSADYDLVAGIATGSGALIVPVGNGWYRCIITQTLPDTANRSYTVRLNNGSGVTYTGNGTSGAFIWGAQLEAGSFATSVIPTVASQVTRAADVASVNTLSPWYNSVAGTLYAEFVPKGLAPAASNARIIEFNNGTVSNRALIYATPPAANATAFQIRDGGVDQASIALTSTYAVNTTLKVALAMQANDFAATVNAAAPTVDTSGTLPSFSELNIASVRSGVTETFSGWLRRITYYPRRLTNAELQTLTTL